MASLTLACLRFTSSQKAATIQLLKPMCEWGKENLSLKNSGLQSHHPAGKPPPWDAAQPRSPLAAASSLAHVEQVTKSDHCLTNLTSNLPQVKNDLHSLLTFLYSRIRMNQVEKWNNLKMQWQMPNLQNAVLCIGPPCSSVPSLLYWLRAGWWGTEIVLRHSRMCAC